MKGILKPTKEKYIVNEEKGAVTYFIEFVPKIKDTPSFSMYLWNAIEKQGFKDYAYFVVGKAKCSPEDTFDLKKGIQIARNRAEIKLAQVEQRVIYSILKEMNYLTENLSWLYNSRSEMIKEKKNFIKNI